MKVYLEGKQQHTIVERDLALHPGVNDVPDDLAKTLLRGAEEEAKRTKLPPKIRAATADDEKPKRAKKTESAKGAKPSEKAATKASKKN